MDNQQCLHILLAVCHDGGYVPLLKSFAADKTVRDRITLVFGAKIAQSFRTLDWPWTIEFPSVFSSTVGVYPLKIPNLPSETKEMWDAVWSRAYKERNNRESPKARNSG